MRRPPRIRSAVVRTAGLAVVAALAAALVGCSSESWEDRCTTTPQGVIECAPDNRPVPKKITGDLLGGGSYDLSQDRGQVVVVNFWGSWCPPCRAEAADLEATHQASKDRGVRFLGINVQDSRDKAIAFEEGRVTYPSIFDPGSRQALAFKVLPPNATPATIVLDREGRVAVVIRRAVRQAELQPLVDRIAAEESTPANGAR